MQAATRLSRAGTQAEVLFNKDKQGPPFEALLGALDGKLAGRTFLVGETVTPADVALASHLLFLTFYMPQVLLLRLAGSSLSVARLLHAHACCRTCLLKPVCFMHAM